MTVAMDMIVVLGALFVLWLVVMIMLGRDSQA